MRYQPTFSLERLELRRLLAEVSGVVFEDLNSNGVQDPGEPGLAGVRVFVDSIVNDRYDPGERQAITDANGGYRIVGIPAGDFYIRQELQPGFAQLSPGADGTRRNGFNIDVEKVGVFEDDVFALFEQAARRWESVIRGDLPDVLDARYGLVDDILILASLEDIDGERGVLARAGPTEFRFNDGPGANLPWLAEMAFDKADTDSSLASGSLLDTITHEMGHALGFGTIWDSFNLVSGFGSTNPRYIGEHAVAEYQLLVPNDPDPGVPLENVGVPFDGSYGGHWRSSALSPELMVAFAPTDALGDPIVPTPLSRLTVAAMKDLGYEVELQNAEPFAIDQPSGERPDFVPATGDLRPFAILVNFGSDLSAIEGVNFSNRVNTGPDVGYFNADLLFNLAEEVVPDVVQLRMGEVIDREQDDLLGVVFWRESNGEPGLQSRGPNPDAYISFKTFARGREFKTWAPTSGSGVNTFYARAYDEYGFITQAQVQIDVDVDNPVADPTNLRGVPLDANTVRFTWDDNANDEVAYFLQVTDEPFLSDAELSGLAATGQSPPRIQTFRLPPNTTSYTVRDLPPASQVYARVSAENAGSFSEFAVSDRVITRSTNEIIIDNENSLRAGVELIGPWQTLTDGRGFIGQSYAASTSGQAVFKPGVPVEGRYLVFARYPEGATATSVPVDITDKFSTTRITLDQTARAGNWVLLGVHEFKRGRFGSIVFNADEANGTVHVDAVRIQPTFV